jgi:hypothetical protein
MTREHLYEIFGSTCSPETADAIAEELARFPCRSQRAFIAWTQGYDQIESAMMAGISTRTLRRMQADIRDHYAAT